MTHCVIIRKNGHLYIRCSKADENKQYLGDILQQIPSIPNSYWHKDPHKVLVFPVRMTGFIFSN